MTVLDSLTAIREVVVTLAAAVGAVVAAIGLSTWRRQLRGGHSFELARRLLRSANRVRGAISQLRNPFVSPAEFPVEPMNPVTTPFEAERLRNLEFAFDNR